MIRYPQLYSPNLTWGAGLSLVQGFSWTETLDEIPTAELTVSLEDNVVLYSALCGYWVHLWDGSRDMGFYRIRSREIAYHDQGGTVTLQLDRGECTLLDDMVPGVSKIQPQWLIPHQSYAATSGQVAAQLLSTYQGLVDSFAPWTLVNAITFFNRDVYWRGENANLLSALYGAAGQCSGDWRLIFDCTDPGGSWTITRGTCGTETAIIQTGRNLLSLRVTEDSLASYARVYPTGTDEDGNEINISSVNSGVKYLQNTGTAGMRGVGHIELDCTDPQTLKDKAGEILALCSAPRVTYELSCVDLYPETGDPNDLILPGKAVRIIDTAKQIDVTAICESVSKSDAWNRPGEMSVTLRTGTRRQKTLIETLADKTLETGGTTLG